MTKKQNNNNWCVYILWRGELNFRKCMYVTHPESFVLLQSIDLAKGFHYFHCNFTTNTVFLFDSQVRAKIYTIRKSRIQFTEAIMSCTWNNYSTSYHSFYESFMSVTECAPSPPPLTQLPSSSLFFGQILSHLLKYYVCFCIWMHYIWTAFFHVLCMK